MKWDYKIVCNEEEKNLKETDCGVKITLTDTSGSEGGSHVGLIIGIVVLVIAVLIGVVAILG